MSANAASLDTSAVVRR